MNIINFVIVAVFIVSFALLITPKLTNQKAWSATVTPLASIIGSGFLVSVPLLASAIGIWAVLAIIVLTALTYLIGGAIRYNIHFGESMFKSPKISLGIKTVETLSHLVLIGAYFISVGYYLVLLSVFSFKLLGLDNPFLGKVIASTIVVLICAVGTFKGLSGVEKAEKYTVSANLAAIAAMLIGLLIFGFDLPNGYSWSAAAKQDHVYDWDTFRFVMGLLVIVQGFEITRFMGQMYDAETRISAMKRSQKISSIVYVIFFILMVPLFPYFPLKADVAGVIEVLGRVTPWLPFIVMGGAIASQFSASVADSIGAGGLISDTTDQKITPKRAYILIGLASVFVIWETDVLSIVTLASRAFALFYGLQCVVASLIARDRSELRRSFGYGFLALLAFSIAILGIPAGG